MKRVTVIAAVAAMILSPFVAAGQDRGGRHGGGGGSYQRYQMADRDRDRGGRDGRDRAPEREQGREQGRDPGRGGGRGRDDGRYEPAPRGYPRDDGPYQRYEPRAYRGQDPRGAASPYGAPPAYAAAPTARGARTYRQGEYLPPAYRGSVVRDPGRYRLRAAPPGYDWVGVGPDIYLMQRNSGMVLDTIPGGY